MTKKRKNRKKSSVPRKTKPDEYYSRGPLEMARFGKVTILRNNMSEEQFEEMQNRHIAHFPMVCREIDEKVSKIAELVRTLHPDRLLIRAYWEMAHRELNLDSEIEADEETMVSRRMLDYLQSIIASVAPADSLCEEATDEQWHSLRELVRGLFSQLNGEFQICRTAANQKNNSEFNMDREEFYYRAQMYWCNVRGHRYLVHQLPYFQDVLTPHDAILRELFGIGSRQLLDGIRCIQDSLTTGIMKAVQEFHEFRDVTMPKVEAKLTGIEGNQEVDLPTIMSQVLEENNWESWQDDIFGRLFGTDLFDVEKISGLPSSLLDELSWEPGQDTEFFAPGEYRGWPLRVWPIFKRPFIKLDGHYYCFELYAVFDHLYRALQRIITRKRPDYSQVWNSKQCELSESLPLKYFEKLMPGATVFHPVYYQWRNESGERKRWCEADAIIMYQDHLFIVEVKAGAFTHTSPATDFPAYIKSLEGLLLAPAKQGQRFFDYLESQEEVGLFNKEHLEIGRLARRDFKHVTVCAITLDPFTEIAAKAQHLSKIGIDVGQRPVWSLSLDDLQVYTDIFDNPLVFLHYVENRMRAFGSDLVECEDELDHLGLYIEHNAYAEYAAQVNSNQPTMWHGYRLEIDRFFSRKLRDPSAQCLISQKMPARLKEVIDVLAADVRPGSREVSSTLLDCDSEWRHLFANGVDEALARQASSGRTRPFSTYGGVELTVFCWQAGAIERNPQFAVEFANTAMLAAQGQERLLLELIFDSSRKLVGADFRRLDQRDIPEAAREDLNKKAQELKRKRITQTIETGVKIGRNDLCPCGSGKKYKRCCMLSPPFNNIQGQGSP